MLNYENKDTGSSNLPGFQNLEGLIGYHHPFATTTFPIQLSSS